MTVTYSSKVANATFFGFHQLLLRWKGSIYKLLYREFILFALLYTVLSVVYRIVLSEDQKRLFEKLSMYCDKYAEQIPVTFVLGDQSKRKEKKKKKKKWFRKRWLRRSHSSSNKGHNNGHSYCTTCCQSKNS